MHDRRRDADRHGRSLADAEAAHLHDAHIACRRFELGVFEARSVIRQRSVNFVLMDDGADPFAQLGELGRGLDSPRVAIARERADEIEVEARDDASRAAATSR